jgi:ribose-phosphate pyrophosphokinase
MPRGCVREADHRGHPRYFYARQTVEAASPSARLVADMLQSAERPRAHDRPHAGQVQGFFHIPVDHMTAIPLFAQYSRPQPRRSDRGGVADTGRTKPWASRT